MAPGDDPNRVRRGFRLRLQGLIRVARGNIVDDPFKHELVAGQSPGFIKRADVDFSAEWNSERLGAKYPLFLEVYKRGVDRDC